MGVTINIGLIDLKGGNCVQIVRVFRGSDVDSYQFLVDSKVLLYTRWESSLKRKTTGRKTSSPLTSRGKCKILYQQ